MPLRVRQSRTSSKDSKKNDGRKNEYKMTTSQSDGDSAAHVFHTRLGGMLK